MDCYSYSVIVSGDESGIFKNLKKTGLAPVTMVDSIDDVKIKSTSVVVMDKAFDMNEIREMKKPYNGQPAVTCSIGVYFSKSFHGDIAKCIDNADKALYKSKDGGRNAICFSDIG